MGGASNYFQGYQSTLGRVMFTEMLDDHMQRNNQRRLSIVGPCYTHDQWLAVQAERQRKEAQATDAAPVVVGADVTSA
jgi:3-deoxy-D-arabino-heptulosonate 7-phosphate (DAHP) synthase